MAYSSQAFSNEWSDGRASDTDLGGHLLYLGGGLNHSANPTSSTYSLPYGQRAPYQQSYGASNLRTQGIDSGYGGMSSRVHNEPQLPPSREALARLHGSVPPIVERPDIVITQGMPIPEQKIGWIIGSRGSYVKQLEQRSGCSLRISDDTSTEYGIVWRYVMMRGTGIALMRCKQLIQMRLDRLPPNAEVAQTMNQYGGSHDVLVSAGGDLHQQDEYFR
jgi:hypothetical protein